MGSFCRNTRRILPLHPQQAHCVELRRCEPQRSLPPCGGGTGRGVQHALHLCFVSETNKCRPRFESATRLAFCSVLRRHPSPCPSPPRGEGTLWQSSAPAPAIHARNLYDCVSCFESKKKIGPCLRLWARGSPAFLSFRFPRNEGVGAPTRRIARITPGGCPDYSGP
jgi:hypothetical protein